MPEQVTQAELFTARALHDGVKAGFAAVVDDGDGWPIGHFMKLSDAERVARALNLSAADELSRMREALEPFAKAADAAGSAWSDETLLGSFSAAGLTIGDLRRARAALQENRNG